jgi:hypothetical protein
MLNKTSFDVLDQISPDGIKPGELLFLSGFSKKSSNVITKFIDNMPKNKIELNDIWYTSGCNFSDEKPDQFLIIEIPYEYDDSLKGKRLSDGKTFTLPNVIAIFPNWKLIKRGNKTICEYC